MARAMATRCCCPPESLAGMIIAALDQADPAQPLLADGHGFVLAHLLDLAQAEGDVFQGGEVGKQIELLEGHAGERALAGDLALRQALAATAFLAIADGLAGQPDAAALELFQQVDAAQQGGLARAAGADQGDHVAAIQGQVDALEHLHGAKALVQVIDAQQGDVGIGHGRVTRFSR